jgi:hypothetical protein
MADGIQMNMKPLQDFIKALKNPKSVHIGVLEGNDGRSDGKSNATIGARWEFDQATNRSFLRIPIIEHMQERLESSTAFGPEAVAHILEEKNLDPWVDYIGATAKQIVLDGFHSSGFGKWTPNSPSTIARKGHSNVLVDTEQLRDSIDYKLVGGSSV